MVNDEQGGERPDYARNIGDDVVAGIRDGIRSGARRGTRRGVVAGIRDSLARGLVGAGGGGLDAVAGRLKVSELDLSSVKGRLDEAGKAVVRQLRYRVRETDKVRSAIEEIKQRVVSELPRNPLSGAIGRKAQESLDGGLEADPEGGQGDTAAEAPMALRKNVKSAVEEMTSFLIYTIIREVTSRAIAEAGRGRKGRDAGRLEGRLVKLERSLGTRSEKGLDKALVESIDQVEDIVTDESMHDISFHAKIDEAFGGSFKDYVAALSEGGMSPAGKALAVSAAVVAAAALIWAVLYFATPFGGRGSAPPSDEPTPTVARTAEPTAGPAVTTVAPDAEPTQSGRLPDLVITYVEADDVGSQSVPEYIVRYRIENAGDAEAGPGVAILTVGGKRHCEDEVGAMGPGKGYDGAFICTVSESELPLVRVCADGLDQVAELDEDNNCAEYE